MVWVGSHYRTREPVVLPDLRFGFLCENKDASKQWFIDVKPITLTDMGLEREEKSDKIVVMVK